MRALALAAALLLPALALGQALPPAGTGAAVSAQSVSSTAPSGSMAYGLYSGARLVFDLDNGSSKYLSLSSGLIASSVGLSAPTAVLTTTGNGPALSITGVPSGQSAIDIAQGNRIWLDLGHTLGLTYNSGRLFVLGTGINSQGDLIVGSTATVAGNISSTSGYILAGRADFSLVSQQGAGMALDPNANVYIKEDTAGDVAVVGGAISAGSSKNAANVTLSGGTGTATVKSGAKCTCSNTTSAIVCKPTVSGTTLTLTSGAGTDTVAYTCL